jgi:hypothetical protein
MKIVVLCFEMEIMYYLIETRIYKSIVEDIFWYELITKYFLFILVDRVDRTKEMLWYLVNHVNNN